MTLDEWLMAEFTARGVDAENALPLVVAMSEVRTLLYAYRIDPVAALDQLQSPAWDADRACTALAAALMLLNAAFRAQPDA